MSISKWSPDSIFLFSSICDDGSPFWDPAVSWNTTTPTLTPCFIDTALVWPPLLLIWIFCPYMIYDWIYRSNRPPVHWNFYNILKISLAIFLSFIGLIHGIFLQIDSKFLKISSAHLMGVWLNVPTYCLFVTFLFLQRRHGFVNCGINWFYLLFLIILNGFSIATTRTYFSKRQLIFTYIEYSLQVLLFLICSFSDNVPNIEEIMFGPDYINNKSQSKNDEKKLKPKRKLCPKETASVPSKLTFGWFTRLTIKGWRRPLTVDDLWYLPYWNQSSYLFKEFNKLWKHPSFLKKTDQKEDINRNHKEEKESNIESIIKTNESSSWKKAPKTNLWSMFGKMFWLYALLPTVARLGVDILQLIHPMILKLMIQFVNDKQSPSWKGIAFSFIFVICNVFQSITTGYHSHRLVVLSMRIRSILVSTIYRKSLVLAQHSKKNYSTGEIVNLMAVDAQRFTEMVQWIHFLWTAPIQIAIGLYMLWNEMGPAVIGGVIIMLATIPINSIVARKVNKIQRKQMKLKDIRVKSISEMLNGMKVLKLYAWEDAFIEKIHQTRLTELSFIKKSGLVSTIFVCFGSCSSFLVSVATFTIYVLITNGTLTAEKAFVSISLFNLLRIPLILIPNMISGFILMLVSMKRINKFLNQDENQDYVIRKPMEKDAIQISNASFSWGTEDDTGTETESVSKPRLVLSNITVSICKKKLIAVVGPVGSGKSSFLYSLLGEMNRLQGTVKIDQNQKLAFVPQQAWIQNLTLRENILFGKSFNALKYEKVIKACALKADFEMLTGGDQTEIGEKGINLSGGQKQRVNIARACYSDADLFLFDDPLSAVDSHVGKHIFEQVLSSEKGILEGKTRILVTNALYVLPYVDEVILIKDGKIEDTGSYRKLLETNVNFQELIKNYTQSNDDVVDDDEGGDKFEEPENSIMVEPELLEKINGLPRSISAEVKPTVGRQNSQLSMRSSSIRSSIRTKKLPVVSDTGKKDPTKLVEAESVETGQISLAVYKKFIMAISPLWFTLIMINYIGSISSSALSNVWLSIWTDHTENFSDDTDSNTKYLSIYFSIGFCQVFFVLFGWISITMGTMTSSKTLHKRLLTSIVHAPMNFFDTTPLGRILNRFSKDIDVLDNYIQPIIRILLNNLFQVFATMIIVAAQTPIFLAFVIPFMIVYFFIQRFYVSTSRQLKRIESVSRSPIFTHFSETINGVSTIKAYGANDRFIEESNRRVDHNQRCLYPSQVANCWLQIRLEFLANCLVFFASFMATLTKNDLTGSKIGLSLSYALNVTLGLNWCVRMFAEMENNIVSVERISEYTDVQSEAAWKTDYDQKLSGQWPEQGQIKFDQYATRYRPGLDLVLKNISMEIGKGEKIGIVGRTGAGKSSLTLALFRLIEATGGKIIIDGADISRLGLQKLRSRLTIIPQDPVLFQGTLRFNLDPFDSYTDEKLWKVLELSHLKNFVETLESGLQYSVSESGENLSVGQRQLVCLARALLRQTNILVLDEATAAVDLETDSLIQTTIRTEFSHCTVLTIAHRLNTIIDSDRVLVLDAGRIAEFDSPKILLENSNSMFYSLAKDAGIVQ